MRIGMSMLVGAALSFATPLAAQGANPVNLAPGEVLAQAVGIGRVRNQPEVATFHLTVVARANTAAAARTACDAALRDIRAKLQNIGVPETAITLLPPSTTQMGFIGNEAYSDDDAPNPAGAAALLTMARQNKVATAGIQIELTDMMRLTAVRQFLSEREDVVAQPPTLSLRNDTTARRAAITQAIAKAREEADAYAHALGLRVARVVRIFNPAASTEQLQAWSQMITLMNGGTTNDVITDARVGLEVVLAPR